MILLTWVYLTKDVFQDTVEFNPSFFPSCFSNLSS